MLIEAMGQIIDPMQVSDWGDTVNSKLFRQRLFKQTIKKYSVIKNTIVYGIAYNNDEYELFATDDNTLTGYIVYYCRIRSNSTRNGLFNPNVGFSTSAVWRDLFFPIRGFALDVYDKVISEKLIDKCIISDMQQTEYGIRAFASLSNLLCAKRWSLYIGFSAPSDASCLIKVTPKQLGKCRSFVFGKPSAYAFRCCVLLKPTVNPISILNKPQNTLVLTYDEAVDLGVFVNPIPLSELQEILLDSELNRPQKH